MQKKSREKIRNSTNADPLPKIRLNPGIAAICGRFEAGRTTASVWRSHLNKILEAAIGDEKQKVHMNWLKELLELLSSGNSMERGLRSAPSMTAMLGILTKLGGLLTHSKNDSLSSPLQVVIFGGSVTEGAGCNNLPPEIKPFLPGNMKLKDGDSLCQRCAWPSRLQLLVDAFLGPNSVKIHNLAVGGTNTMLSLPVLEYRLYPANLDILRQQGADVIVNAYSVNDNLFSWDGSELATMDLRHFRGSALKTESFYHTALKSRPCPPLVLFVDEYFGNQNALLLGEDIRNDAVQLFANAVNDMGYISSSAAARHRVYANTNETLFSPNWSLVPQKPEVHFGMPGHQNVAWVVAYSVLKLVMDFCEDMHDTHPTIPEGDAATNVLRSQDSSAIDETQSKAAFDCNSGSATSIEQPCSFAFVATPAGTVNTVPQLNRYIKSFRSSSSNGWNGENDYRYGWQNKLGLVAQSVGASLKISIPNLSNKVRVITIHFLKRYGEQWENSKALVNFTVSDTAGKLKREVSFILTGYHNQSTSLTFPFTLDLGLKSADVGETAALNITLINGTKFKITALMMCSR